MVNAFDPSSLATLPPSAQRTVQRRIQLLGPAYRLFYQTPVEVCRGEGVWLFDSQGEQYLDAYNNVASVGHAHPRVAAAVAEQMKVLCTHTRYLQDGILDYAEQLLATFGGSMTEHGHMMFTCTGSEANDLAMRIAKKRTGRRGIIVTSEAYHGNSELTAGFSPSLGKHSPLGTWVRQVPTPDSYRLDAKGMGEWFAGKVQEQIDDLERHGDGLAAFIADSVFSSDGIYSHPIDLLGPVAEVVRKAGGIFVADEVQSGFGRTGDALWGYQRHGVAPDIVTMGKPMGNGFPVAAIAIKPEVLADFASDTRYFNTFGGNTVAIAAAQATLNVIQEEKLQENAREVGEFLRDGFWELAKRHDRIGDVRGAGLFIGVELVKDRDTKQPDPQTAAALVNGLRERRVLISATGYHAITLKIRPPLVFQRSHAERLLSEVDSLLSNS